MNGTFTLTCKECGCKIQIKTTTTHMPKPIFCFNCRQELPEYAHTALRNAIVAVHDLPAHTVEEDGQAYSDSGFVISLDAVQPDDI